MSRQSFYVHVFIFSNIYRLNKYNYSSEKINIWLLDNTSYWLVPLINLIIKNQGCLSGEISISYCTDLLNVLKEKTFLIVVTHVQLESQLCSSAMKETIPDPTYQSGDVKVTSRPLPLLIQCPSPVTTQSWLQTDNRCVTQTYKNVGVKWSLMWLL